MTPAECATMAEIRAEIDRVDAALVALLVERASYIDRASELKPALGLPARIDDRVEDVVAKVRARAIAEGLDPALVEALWRRLIDWSIAREEAVIGPD
ncbi:MAG: chorismate mutase [Paracoccaceae bacterium]